MYAVGLNYKSHAEEAGVESSHIILQTLTDNLS